MALQHSKIFIGHYGGKLLKLPTQLIIKRNTHFDFTNTVCGNREYVGYGLNGSPMYVDLIHHPIPAIRFREPTPEICALRKKEEDDWKNLKKDEIKKLYRYSFCQTFSEFKAPTGEWKLHLGVCLWACAFALLFQFTMAGIYQELPDTFNEDRRQLQLKRMICLEVEPITGLSSKWDYEIGDWK